MTRPVIFEDLTKRIMVAVMNEYVPNGNAEKAGRWFGRVWRRLIRHDKRLAKWLVAKGMSGPAVNATIWAVRLTVLLGVLQFSLILAAVIVVLLIVANAVSHADLSIDEEQPRWRDGLAGYGLYRGWVRIDLYDPDEKQ